jgi:hypothetical protein
MKKNIILLLSLSIVIINSCSVSNQAYNGKKIKFSAQAGSNIGGITENTNMSLVPGIVVPPEASADAFTGATKTGFNGGVHMSRSLKRNKIETGIDYMYNHQTFKYIDAGNIYVGVRELNVSQLILPLSYNLTLFRKQLPEADIQLKAGYLGQLNFITTEGYGILPDYSLKRFSNGVTAGISALPFKFENGSRLGFYFDVYRGSRIYTDFYNQTGFEMPGSSFMKFGVKFQF